MNRYVPTPSTVLRTAAYQAKWDREEFDRVLNQVKAEAWDEGYDEGIRADDRDFRDNPYRDTP